MDFYLLMLTKDLQSLQDLKINLKNWQDTLSPVISSRNIRPYYILLLLI